jgi:hypothetical protein
MIVGRFFGGMGWALALAFWLLWMSRPTPDDYVPKFAKVPYEAFSREAAVAIALREWHLFGDRMDNASRSENLERSEGLWQRVGEYWWVGVGPHFPDRAWTGKHDENGKVFGPEQSDRYAWSAAFISYVMRIAGAGNRFPYSDAHSDFITTGRKSTPESKDSLKAMRPEGYAPRLGDLICFSRDRNKVSSFDEISHSSFRAHCAIVVEAKPGAISVIGGNVGNAVAMSRVPASQQGMIARADGHSIDDGHSWFVVIAVPYSS